MRSWISKRISPELRELARMIGPFNPLAVIVCLTGAWIADARWITIMDAALAGVCLTIICLGVMDWSDLQDRRLRLRQLRARLEMLRATARFN